SVGDGGEYFFDSDADGVQRWKTRASSGGRAACGSARSVDRTAARTRCESRRRGCSEKRLNAAIARSQASGGTKMENLTLTAKMSVPYDEAVARAREAFANEGFGILTEIDITKVMKAKLDVDLPKQVILGACRPQLAYAALQAN